MESGTTNGMAPGDHVRGVMGRTVGSVVDVASNAFAIDGPHGRLWLEAGVVLRARGGTVVLKCPGGFVRQYRVPGG